VTVSWDTCKPFRPSSQRLDMPHFSSARNGTIPSRRGRSWQQVLCHSGRWPKVLFHPFWAGSMTCARPLSPGIVLNRAPLSWLSTRQGPSAAVDTHARPVAGV
jgi:hypothetical protein